ncbi:hypothetical protein JXB41_09010 [Candidatus Woesearchaeota archaeon]|nr:hypothetical protein [Candidatus Woesearchaeota archaeon]
MTKIKKRIITGVVLWFILLIVVYSFSALINRNIVVFILGGAYSLFFSGLFTFIIFFVSYAIPQRIFKKKQEEIIKEYLYQTIVILVFALIEYLVAVRLFVGFNLWEFNIIFSKGIWIGIFSRIFVLMIIGLIAGYLGILFGRSKTAKRLL